MLSARQLAGLDDSHIHWRERLGLTLACWDAFDALQRDAEAAGFSLRIASAFRDFERQRAIFNAKADGHRMVHDDAGQIVDLAALTPDEKLQAILRFSALPGLSRHHWGTDLDVFDAAAVPDDYEVQLSPQEVADDGVFAGLHAWLDMRIADGAAHGFFRPYDKDRGGVAPERWHLSYAPESRECMAAFDGDSMADVLADHPVAMMDRVVEALPALIERYVQRVAPAPAST